MTAQGAAAGLIALAAAALWACGASAQGSACDDLKDLAFPNVRIDVAEAIVPDPVWPFPPNLESRFMPPEAGVRTPFCRVAGVIEAEIGFEVWLPDDWNGRIEHVGNGGYVGDFNYPNAGAALARGHAAVTSDLGHKSTDPLETTWAVGRPDRIENYGRRAHHLAAELAKHLVLARYGRAQDFAYFTGCSAGGWQGLTEASLYPDDYDGVLSIAPANNTVRGNTTQLWWRTHFPSVERVTPENAALVTAAGIAHCDAGDGVTDGIVSLPEACDFDPGALLCEAGEDDSSTAGTCLTPAQLERVRLLHGRHFTAGGLAVYPGYAWGTAFADVSYGSTEDSLTGLAPTDHEWSPETFDFDRDIPPLEAELGETLGRTNPDLSGFVAASGKLIVAHGWADGIITPLNTLDYWASVQETMGEDAVDDFARLYMAPGMGHCGGGPGPDTFDALAPLIAWVERGEAPGSLIASKLGPDRQPVMTRPLCPYPQFAAYDGAGDPNAAESFACEMP
jgi:feruloyl esterase